jgi:hypothetical protein
MTMPTRRKKITTGEAVAAAIVPDPNMPSVPHESPAIPDVPIEDVPDLGLKRRERPTSSVAGRGWGYVVETIISIDPAVEYARLYEALHLGDDATEYGAVLKSSNAAEQNRVDAVRLHRHGKLEEESVLRRVNEEMEILRTSAKAELVREYEKSKDEKGKASMRTATLQDINDRVISNWPDKSAALERQKGEIHAAVRLAEELAQAWSSRCATLRVIMERVAPLQTRQR